MCCNAIRSSFTYATSTVSSALQKATETISGSYTCLSKKIDAISDAYLPEKVSYVAKKAFHSLPITLGMLYLPMSVTIPCLAAYTICRIVHPKPFTNETIGDVNTGIGHAFVVGALRESANIFKKTQTSVLPLVVDLLFATFFHNRAHKAYNKPDSGNDAGTSPTVTPGDAEAPQPQEDAATAAAAVAGGKQSKQN